MNSSLGNFVLGLVIVMIMVCTSSVTIATTTAQEIKDARQESQIWTTAERARC